MDDFKLTKKRKAMILNAIVHEIRLLRPLGLQALTGVPLEAVDIVKDYIWSVAKWIEDTHEDAE